MRLCLVPPCVRIMFWACLVDTSIYIPVWSKFGVWGAFYVLLWLHVPVLVTLLALHALDKAPCFSPSLPEQ